MQKLKGERQVISFDDPLYPELLMEIPDPPKQLYVIGSLEGFKQGLAISGPRKATSYGTSWAGLMAQSASLNGASIVTGGARGIDEAAIRAVVSLYEDATRLNEAGASDDYPLPQPQYVVLGGGCDRVYPAENLDLFQRIIDQGATCIYDDSSFADAIHSVFQAKQA